MQHSIGPPLNTNLQDQYFSLKFEEDWGFPPLSPPPEVTSPASDRSIDQGQAPSKPIPSTCCRRAGSAPATQLTLTPTVHPAIFAPVTLLTHPEPCWWTNSSAQTSNKQLAASASTWRFTPTLSYLILSSLLSLLKYKTAADGAYLTTVESTKPGRNLMQIMTFTMIPLARGSITCTTTLGTGISPTAHSGVPTLSGMSQDVSGQIE
jgi:hypothetical protein